MITKEYVKVELELTTEEYEVLARAHALIILISDQLDNYSIYEPDCIADMIEDFKELFECLDNGFTVEEVNKHE